MWVSLTIAGLMLQQAPAAGLVSYEESVRCAGLTQAASELEGGESAEGRSLYDAALFWSLAAMQAAPVSRRCASSAPTPPPPAPPCSGVGARRRT